MIEEENLTPNEEITDETTPDSALLPTEENSESVADEIDKNEKTGEDEEQPVPSSSLPTLSKEETEILKKSSEQERFKTYKTGTKVAAFLFFLITLAVFVVYMIFATEFLFKIFASKPENFGEAIGAIFGGIFGLVMTFIFGVAQLPENIIAIILFKRLRGRSDKKWENVLFTVMFALSIVMLLVMILTIVLFFATTARG